MFKFINIQKVIAVALFIFASWLPTQAYSAIVHESGDGYHVIEYFAGQGEAGSVTMRIETILNGATSSKFQVNSSIVEVKAAEGWGYEIIKFGGINSVIVVDFERSNGCQATFKAKYLPGKTNIDGGAIKC